MNVMLFLFKDEAKIQIDAIWQGLYYHYNDKLFQPQPKMMESMMRQIIIMTSAVVRVHTLTSTSSTLSLRSLVANLLMRMSIVSLNCVTVSLEPMFTSGKMFKYTLVWVNANGCIDEKEKEEKEEKEEEEKG